MLNHKLNAVFKPYSIIVKGEFEQKLRLRSDVLDSLVDVLYVD